MSSIKAVFQSKDSYISTVVDPKKPIIDKIELITDACRGKKVLDLGCIDHSYETAVALGDRWLHKKIKDVAKFTAGLDILEEDAKKLNKLGYNIFAGNAEDFDIGEKFDVIVAGDLVEHLSNIGNFLESVSRHMHSESVFIFSTPNPFNIEQMLAASLTDRINVHPQHVAWLDPYVCWELLSRAGFSIQGFHWINTRFEFYLNKPVWRLFVNRWARWVMKRSPLCRRDFAVVVQLRA